MSERKPVLSPTTSFRRATVDSPGYHGISSSTPRSTEFRPYFVPPTRRTTYDHERDANILPALRAHSPMVHSQPGTPDLTWTTAGNSPDTNLSQPRSPQESEMHDSFGFQTTHSPFAMSVSLPSMSSSGSDSTQPRITPLNPGLDPLFHGLSMSHPHDVATDRSKSLDRTRTMEMQNTMLRPRIEEHQWDRMQHSNPNLVAASMFPSQMSYHPNSNEPNPSLGPPPIDWQRRTEARVRRYCGLNRAGNALCAWHDSRRERRQYPPRMAPPNTLNCGCTYGQALFEESLTRNHVGSYMPGESVRMDPVLRNALLKLLEDVYGYRDGDFERLPNGTWKPGEDAASWEHKATTKPSRRETR